MTIICQLLLLTYRVTLAFLQLFMEGAGGDVDTDLDVAEATEGEAEEVLVAVVDVTAIETGQLTLLHLDHGIGGEGLLGELDVFKRVDSVDCHAEPVEIAVGHLGQTEPARCGTGHGPLGQEEVDIGIMTDMLVGHPFLHAADEDHTGNEVLVDHAPGAVGVDMKHFLTGNIGLPLAGFGAVPEKVDTGVGVFLMGEKCHEPDAAGYSRASRFVQSTYRVAGSIFGYIHKIDCKSTKKFSESNDKNTIFINNGENQ